MNVLATIRQRHATATRRALGVFVLLWASMAIQPCAMAFDSDRDCPHCPPAHEREMASHHGHGSVKDSAPCASLQAQCGDLDEISIDSRDGQLKVKDTAEQPVVAVTVIPEFQFYAGRNSIVSVDPPEQSTRAQALHVLYCVYLK